MCGNVIPPAATYTFSIGEARALGRRRAFIFLNFQRGALCNVLFLKTGRKSATSLRRGAALRLPKLTFTHTQSTAD